MTELAPLERNVAVLSISTIAKLITDGNMTYFTDVRFKGTQVITYYYETAAVDQIINLINSGARVVTDFNDPSIFNDEEKTKIIFLTI